MNHESASSQRLRASVVVPSRGGRERLPVLLEALLHQSRADFEVIVVLDGDVDGSNELLLEYERTTPWLRHVVFSDNRGRSKALNTGFGMARGDVLIRCDDDLEPAPDYIDLNIRENATTAPSAVIGIYDNTYPETPYARVYGDPMNQEFQRAAFAAGPDSAWRYWAGNCSMTRSAYELVGEYDEDYRKYGWEDVDMGFRLHQCGVPVKIVPSLTTPHHVAATTTEVRSLRALHAGAARELFVAKHGSEALGPRHGVSGVWDLLVRGVSLVMTEAVVRFAARLVDAALTRVPRPVGKKLVALCVESAALSGMLHPDRARTTF